MDSKFVSEELKENLNYLSSHRYLKRFVPLCRQDGYSVPLGLRRSVSLEETTINDKNSLKSKSSNNSNVSLPNCSLSYSVESLCFCLKPYQLLDEYNDKIAKCCNEHKFDWWNTIDYLRPLCEKVIFCDKFLNSFEDDLNEEDLILNIFQKKCKRNKRRNGICFGIDRLYYNEQMILFVAITTELQIEFNLMSSGFKIQ